jgi:hypothetical protein
MKKYILDYKNYLIRFTIPKTGNKKYKAEVYDLSGKRVATSEFGDRRYQQFKDRIGYYSDLDHNDKKRRDRYRKRHEAILTKDGIPAYKVEFSPAWYSYLYLW